MEAYVQADVPASIGEAFALGRMTALRKDNGKVRGIVTGNTFRRIASRALAMQFAEAFQVATAPFQYALSTRAGMDAMGIAIRYLTDDDEILLKCSNDMTSI